MPRPETTGGLLALFDIDGTLMRGAGPHHRQALQAGILAELELQATMDGIDTAGTLDRDLLRLMVQNAGKAAASPEAIARVAALCESSYLENCADDLRAFVCPGVRELLAALRDAGATLGVVTGNLQAIGWKKLELAGLRDFFQVGAFSQDGGTRAELAGRAAQRASANAGGVRFHSIALLGDHRNDVIAAKANGFRAIAVATGVLSVEELLREQPDLVVADLTGLTIEALFGLPSVTERTSQSR